MPLNKNDNQIEDPETPKTEVADELPTTSPPPQTETVKPTPEEPAGENFQQFFSETQSPKDNVEQTQTHNAYKESFVSNDINSLFETMISPLADGGDGEIQRLIELGQATINEKGNESLKQSVRFHSLPKNLTGSFSAVIVSMRKIINSQPVVGMQIYIIESSRAEIESEYVDTQNLGRIEIIVPTIEAYDSMMPVAVNATRNAYRGDGDVKVVSCGVQIITREASIKTMDDMRPFLNESVKAIQLWLTSLEGKSSSFSLEILKQDPSVRVVSRTVVTDDQITRPNGLPVRSDIVTELKMVRQKQSNSVRLNNEIEMAKTATFVELVYTPPAPPVYGQPQQPWHYVPRITLSSISTEIAAAPLEFILLGIANATILGRNKAYGIAYRTNYSNPDKVNLRDLGAVGYQVPGLAEKAGMIDVSSSDTDLRKLMDAVLNPNPVYTLEIEQSGLNSWLLGIFATAAEPSEEGVRARRLIAAAADRLTSGRYSKLLRQATSREDIDNIEIIRDTRDRNVVGYYNLNGARRDLRELDLLAILNLHGSKSPDLVNDYIRTLITGPGAEDPFIRLHQRLGIIRTFVSDVVVKGYSNKYDFTGIFINTLVMAIEQTGLTVNSNTTGLRDNQIVNQTAQDWASVMANPSIGNQLFGGNVSANGYVNNSGIGNMPNFNGHFYR